MFSLTRKDFIVLLSFSFSAGIKCLSLNDEPCTLRSNFIGLNPIV